jgi:hypothetical protein
MVVTEAVWKAVQGGLPALAQVISLGVHEVPDLSDMRPQTLTELSASCISQRTFPPVPSRRCLVPGYRQAPEVHEDLTCMFCNVMSCPAAPAGIDQEEFTQAYDTSIVLSSELVRRLLRYAVQWLRVQEARVGQVHAGVQVLPGRGGVRCDYISSLH